MKYILLLISSLHQFVDFTVFASDALENYYKSTIVLDVYHEKYASHLRNRNFQLSLGPRSVDYSTTTLLFEEEETNVSDLIMRKEDIQWNHMYLSATPFEPLTLVQNFANGFAWFSAFREMVNFRVGALFYKKKNKDDLSKNCSLLAAYFTMFQFILVQDRLYEFGNIIDDYKREKTSSFWPDYFKPGKDSNSGRDALATAANMELLGKVTRVLNEVVEYRTVRRQFPVQPRDAWFFPANEERAKTTRSAVDVVKEELSFDFYLREAPEEEKRDAGLAEKLWNVELEDQPADEFAAAKNTEAFERLQSPSTRTEPKEDQASSSAVAEETIAAAKEPSEAEKERKWREFSDKLTTIDQKYDNNFGDYDEFYYTHLWKELLAIYGDAFVQVTEYFHFAITGSSYKSTVENWTDSFEDYVPNMDESVALWEHAEKLFAVAKEDFESEKSGPEKELKSRPIAILQTIETIRLRHREENALIDENRMRRKWTLEYVNPKDTSADLRVI